MKKIIFFLLLIGCTRVSNTEDGFLDRWTGKANWTEYNLQLPSGEVFLRSLSPKWITITQSDIIDDVSTISVTVQYPIPVLYPGVLYIVSQETIIAYQQTHGYREDFLVPDFIYPIVVDENNFVQINGFLKYEWREL
jgi:hypothetical protein